MLFLCSYQVAREAMLAAYQSDMINGEYAFILFELGINELYDKMEYPSKWFVSHYIHTLHTDPEIKKAFGAVLLMAPKLPGLSYLVFEAKLKRRISDLPWNSSAYVEKIPGTPYFKHNSRVCKFNIFGFIYHSHFSHQCKNKRFWNNY